MASGESGRAAVGDEAAASAAAAERDRLRALLDTVVHAIAHDLRAPVRAIDGFSRVLEEDAAAALGPEARAHLGFVRGGARRLDAMIEGLVALLRIDRRFAPRPDVAMDEVVRGAASTVAAQVAATGAARPPRFAIGELGRCPGDPALLAELWTRLLENAAAATRHAVDPLVEVERVDAPPGLWRCRVRDNGMGFDPACAEDLFRPFRSLHPRGRFESAGSGGSPGAGPGAGAGAGLGLAMASRIVELHGGAIEGTAREGEGATFLVTLPAAVCGPSPTRGAGPAGPSEP